MSIPNEQFVTEQAKSVVAGNGNSRGPRFLLDIEGQGVLRDRDTMTTEEIMAL